jgi:hypothetical protein
MENGANATKNNLLPIQDGFVIRSKKSASVSNCSDEYHLKAMKDYHQEPTSRTFETKLLSSTLRREFGKSKARFTKEDLSEFAVTAFQCFPLKTSFSPGYMQIDTKISCKALSGGYTSREKTHLRIHRQMVRRRKGSGRLEFGVQQGTVKKKLSTLF